jgi:hypothetical protein
MSHLNLPTGRSFTRDTVHPFYIWVEGDEILEYCVYCSATLGELHTVGPVQISRNRECPYQRVCPYFISIYFTDFISIGPSFLLMVGSGGPMIWRT